jgi:hypothetical protein
VALLAGVLLHAIVEIQGAGDCPRPQAVAERLASMLPEGTSPPRDVAEVSVRAGTLVVTLAREGSLKEEPRRVAASGTCTDLAEAAAVIIATWETELHPDIVLRLPRVDVGNAERPCARWDIGAGMLASYASDAAALGGMVWTRAPLGGRWGIKMGLLATETRDEPFAMGSVSWTRSTLSLGGSYRLGGEAFYVDAEASALAGLLWIGGQGFATTQSELDFDPGLYAGLVLGRGAGPIDLWISVGGTGWLREQRVRVTGVSGQASLPRLELLGSAGISMGFGR